jgi:hypothetical protein
MTPNQAATIEALRTAYARIERVDPSQPTYGALCALLDRQPDDMLRLLAAADIRWVSMLAANRRNARDKAAKAAAENAAMAKHAAMVYEFGESHDDADEGAL